MKDTLKALSVWLKWETDGLTNNYNGAGRLLA